MLNLPSFALAAAAVLVQSSTTLASTQRETASVPLARASVTCKPAAAPAGEPDSLDRLMKALLARHGIVGSTVAVEHRGKVVARRAYGMASLELSVPATTCTVYQLSSATKTTTAIVVLRLVQEGRLRLDDSLRTLLPEVPTDWRDVTVRQLLSHTSGLPDVRDVVAPTADSALAIVATHKRSFPTGEAWEYNQTNYFLIKRIVERVTGKTFQEHVRATILEPLGMQQTAFGAMYDVIPGRASSYSPGSVLRVREFNFPEYLYTAAGLNSTVDDLLKWNAALIDGRLVARAWRDTMWTPSRLNSGAATHYGLGWDIAGWPGHRSAGHEGGGNVTIRRFIEDSVTVILLTNGSRHRFPTDDIAERIAAVYAPLARDSASKLTDAMVAALDSGDTLQARAAFTRFRAGPPSRGTTLVGAVNFLGSQLLDLDRPGDALFVYRLNAEAHPDSPGAENGITRALQRLRAIGMAEELRKTGRG